MTHNIRKNAPEGATHYEIVDGEVWYYRLNDDNTISYHSDEWVRDDFIDFSYLESRGVHQLASKSANYWIAAVFMIVLFVVVAVKFYGNGG